MRKWIKPVFWISIVLSTTSATGQYYFFNDKYYAGPIVLEAGCSAGIMNCLTDLGGKKGAGKGFIKDLTWKTTRPASAIYINALYKDRIALRFEASIGSIKSADRLLQKTDPDLTQRYGRNLSFRSRISELQLALEIHPLFFTRYDENKAPYWSPYLIGGIAYFHFNPQAHLEGRWHDLQPLRLEGQGFTEYPLNKPYRLWQFNLPLGIGIKYELSAVLNLRLEIIHRMLFTDYLDDVSHAYIDPVLFTRYLSPPQALIAQKLYSRINELQPGYMVYDGMPRGDPNNNDSYFTIQLKMGWVVRKRR